MRSVGLYSFSGVADALDCGTVWATVQRADSRYLGKFSGYTVSVEQSDRVLRTGRRDSVHQGPGTVRYR